MDRGQKILSELQDLKRKEEALKAELFQFFMNANTDELVRQLGVAASGPVRVAARRKPAVSAGPKLRAGAERRGGVREATYEKWKPKLLQLANAGPVTMRQAALALGGDYPKARAMVTRLKKEGLIVGTPGRNGGFTAKAG